MNAVMQITLRSMSTRLGRQPVLQHGCFWYPCQLICFTSDFPPISSSNQPIRVVVNQKENKQYTVSLKRDNEHGNAHFIVLYSFVSLYSFVFVCTILTTYQNMAFHGKGYGQIHCISSLHACNHSLSMKSIPVYLIALSACVACISNTSLQGQTCYITFPKGRIN